MTYQITQHYIPDDTKWILEISLINLPWVADSYSASQEIPRCFMKPGVQYSVQWFLCQDTWIQPTASRDISYNVWMYEG